MKKFNIPELNVTYFDTYDTMTDATYQLEPESVVNILDTDDRKVQIGSIDFETLETLR